MNYKSINEINTNKSYDSINRLYSAFQKSFENTKSYKSYDMIFFDNYHGIYIEENIELPDLLYTSNMYLGQFELGFLMPSNYGYLMPNATEKSKNKQWKKVVRRLDHEVNKRVKKFQKQLNKGERELDY